MPGPRNTAQATPEMGLPGREWGMGDPGELQCCPALWMLQREENKDKFRKELMREAHLRAFNFSRVRLPRMWDVCSFDSVGLGFHEVPPRATKAKLQINPSLLPQSRYSTQDCYCSLHQTSSMWLLHTELPGFHCPKGKER